MNDVSPLPVDPAWLAEIDGEPNGEAIYLDILVPLMTALGEGRCLTGVQEHLALLGLAHLEILNGGVPLLAFNNPAQAERIPEVLTAFGWSEQARLLARGLALIAPRIRRHGLLDRLLGRDAYASMLAGLDAETQAELDVIESGVADLLQSPDFFRALAAHIRADGDGFRIGAELERG